MWKICVIYQNMRIFVSHIFLRYIKDVIIFQSKVFIYRWRNLTLQFSGIFISNESQLKTHSCILLKLSSFDKPTNEYMQNVNQICIICLLRWKTHFVHINLARYCMANILGKKHNFFTKDRECKQLYWLDIQLSWGYQINTSHFYSLTKLYAQEKILPYIHTDDLSNSHLHQHLNSLHEYMC